MHCARTMDSGERRAYVEQLKCKRENWWRGRNFALEVSENEGYSYFVSGRGAEPVSVQKGRAARIARWRRCNARTLLRQSAGLSGRHAS